MIAATAASVGIGCWHRRARQTNLQHSHSELLPLFTFSRRQCNTTNSNSQRWVWYLLYWETYTGSIIVELPVPFWSRYRSVLIIVQSSLVSLFSVGWRSRSGYYTTVVELQSHEEINAGEYVTILAYDSIPKTSCYSACNCCCYIH